MADEVMFEVNAGQILAKLHLGCKQMLKKATYYNSGIVGKDDGTPENPAQCTFDLNNINDQYEIACDLEEYYVYKTLSKEQVQLLLGKAIKKEGTNDNDYAKKKKQLENMLNEYLPSSQNTYYGQMIGTAQIYKDWIKNFAEAQLQQAFIYLKDYLENFCGKQNASKLTKEQIVPFFIDSPFDYNYDNYTIPESKNVDTINMISQQFDKAFEKFVNDKAGKNIEDVKRFVENDLPKFITDKKNQISIKGLKFKRAYKIGYKVELEIA